MQTFINFFEKYFKDLEEAALIRVLYIIYFKFINYYLAVLKYKI